MRHFTPIYPFVAVCLLLFFLFTGCKKSHNSSEVVFTKISSTDSGIKFTNTVKNTPDFNIFSYRNFYNGGGVAIGDINNDGLSDVYFTANMGENKLFLNKGNLKFDDITSKAGVASPDYWSTGVAMVDINADGFLDIYVCNAGYRKGTQPFNQLFINNGDLTFTEKAKEYGLDDAGYTTHAAFFDYDQDGDLDAYILNNSFIPVNTLNYANKRDLRAEDWPVKDFLKGGGDKLLRNDNGKFVDVSKSAGIYGSLIGFGLGVTVGDINNDHLLDIYVSNDFFERDYLYLNQGNGTFKEDLTNQMQHVSLSSMGADMADINNDGKPDVFATDMLPYDDERLKSTTDFENIDVYNLKIERDFYHQFSQNSLQLNNGDNTFTDIAYYGGVAASDWSWGALIFDADNDNNQDILVCNGIYHDVIDQDFVDFFANDVVQKMMTTGKKEQFDEVINKMPSVPIRNMMFKNNGNLKFEDMSEKWGLDDKTFSNGAAYGDLDNDGDLDLIINNVNQEALFYENNSSKKETKKENYISFQLKGDTLKNTFAIGAKIQIFQGKEIQQRELIPTRGFQSSVDYKLIFGLSSNAKIDSILVFWHDRTFTKLESFKVNSLNVVSYHESTRATINTNRQDIAQNTFFTPEKQNFFQQHIEDDFIDFYYERNIPMMLSKEGPRVAKGDVNGDQLEDIYICGARGQSGQLLLANKNGFTPVKNSDLAKYPEFEETAAHFFDADKDNDLDLFIGSGGNFQHSSSRELQDRLFINDGKGNFSLKPDAFTINGMNTSVAVSYDYDGDGDQDLFVGGRSTPQNYGINPKQYLYENDGKGKFANASKILAPKFDTFEMVTDATWADVDGDAKKELIVVGEWMSPMVLKYKNGVFEKTEIPEFKNKNGWWYAVNATDLDGDGDTDFVLGNRGENAYLGSKNDLPIRLWINDFDKNNAYEKVLTRTVNDRDVPVTMKRDLMEEIPSLKKQNLEHHQFAKKSIQDLFEKDLLKKSLQKEASYFQSSIAINDGKGNFKLIALPQGTQFSSSCAIQVVDVNADKLPDIILAGNHFHFQPQFSRLDGSYGQLLLNKGKGVFELSPQNKNGFGLSLRGQVRDLEEIKIGNNNYLLALVNNASPQLLKYNFTK